jgi:hypothetical protein
LNLQKILQFKTNCTLREIVITEIAKSAKSAKITEIANSMQKKNTSVFLLSFAPDFAVVVVVVVAAAAAVVVVSFNEFF